MYGPCVYAGSSWVTPNQFQHASGRGTARDWKRSIKHHGTSLKALLSSQTLSVDPPYCRCPVCSGTLSASASRQVRKRNTSLQARYCSIIIL